MTSEEKMDLDAIDDLAWFKIISFLDEKSRLQCRHLSRTIKKYVDLTGLTIRIRSSKPFERETKEWKAFLKNPDIRFSKVYISSVKSGVTLADHVGLTPRHCVNYLHVEHLASHSFNELSNLLKADWAQNIQSLVLSTNSLALDPPSEESVNNITLPCLQKLYLIYNTKGRSDRNQKEYDVGRIVDMLFRKIRSFHMELIFVDLIDGVFDDDPTINLRNSFTEFVRLHASTLQTIIFKNCREENVPSTSIIPVEFSEIPYGLKQFDVDFFGYLDPVSSWFKMLDNSIRHLKAFTCYNFTDAHLNPSDHPSLLQNLCQLNCNTLNSVSLTIRDINSAVDLKTFNCCNSLEHLDLQIDNPEIPVYLKHVTMLPASIKSFHVHHPHDPGFDDPVSGEIPRIALDLEHVSDFQKFNKLISLWLNGPVTFKNSGQMIRFTEVLLRLRELDFFELENVILVDRDTSESSMNRKLFYDTLCEGEVTGELEATNGFKLRWTVGQDFRPDMDEDELEDGFGSVYYQHVNGHLNLGSRISQELLSVMEGVAEQQRRGLPSRHFYEEFSDDDDYFSDDDSDVNESVKSWPPPLNQTRFEIEEKRPY